MLLLGRVACVEYDTPPIPVFNVGSPFAAGNKVYGLSFGMLQSMEFVTAESILKMPSGLPFEEESAQARNDPPLRRK